MENVAAILAELSRRGVFIKKVGGRLSLRPKEKVDEGLISLVTAHKSGILTALSGSPLYEPDCRGSVTISLALSGREHIWPRTARWLNDQSFDRSLVRLVLCDCSQSSEFNLSLRNWIKFSDYPDVRLLSFSPDDRGLADVPRKGRGSTKRAHEAVARIYNRISMSCDSEFVLFLEDDIIPPADVVDRLLSGLSMEAATIAAPYRSRMSGRFMVWDKEWKTGIHRLSGGSGVQNIRGSGFGCLLVRSEVLKDYRFGLNGEDTWFDVSWFRNLPDYWDRKVDWSVECEHLHNTPRPGGVITTRHLVYHCAPFSQDGGSAWKSNLLELKRRIDIFNGKRIVAVVEGEGLDPSGEVKDFLSGLDIQFLVKANSRTLRENATFIPLLECVNDPDPSAAVFYAHAKGVWSFGKEDLRQSAALWRSSMYRELLDDWPKIAELLSEYSVVGTHRRKHLDNRKIFPDDATESPWHFSGTFFWIRSSKTFADDRWRTVWRPTGWGAEAWPGRRFPYEESACVAYDDCDRPYDKTLYRGERNAESGIGGNHR